MSLQLVTFHSFLFHIYIYIYIYVDGHLGCFRNLAIVDSDALYVGCIPPFEIGCLYSLGECLELQLLHHRVVLLLTF